jgi:hypothetical protein
MSFGQLGLKLFQKYSSPPPTNPPPSPKFFIVLQNLKGIHILCINVVKLFSLSLMLQQNKLEHLSQKSFLNKSSQFFYSYAQPTLEEFL